MKIKLETLRQVQTCFETLESLGVDTGTGYPGGTLCYRFMMLFIVFEGIRHILGRHEQGCVLKRRLC